MVVFCHFVHQYISSWRGGKHHPTTFSEESLSPIYFKKVVHAGLWCQNIIKTPKILKKPQFQDIKYFPDYPDNDQNSWKIFLLFLWSKIFQIYYMIELNVKKSTRYQKSLNTLYLGHSSPFCSLWWSWKILKILSSYFNNSKDSKNMFVKIITMP